MHSSLCLISPLLASLAVAGVIPHRMPHMPRMYKRDNGTKYAVKEPPLTTDWTYKVGTNPWKEYPRPQLERADWQNLNGIWNYQNAPNLDAVNNPPFNSTLSHEVLVPSCLESGLSGIQAASAMYSWFDTKFEVPGNWNGSRVLLNFAAVDYEATVFVNGQKAGFHRGGYFAFTIDVTQYLSTGSNDLLVFVHDPTDSGDYVIPVGKQTVRPSHIFYTPCSGIWQSVWIERAPSDHITQLDLSADMEGQVNVNVISSSGNKAPVEIEVREKNDGPVVGSFKATADAPFKFQVASPKLWSPSTPTLYDISVKMGSDQISSYTGFRTFSTGQVNGIQRPLINGEFVFTFGTLDQGYWPDGLHTPPSREAMVYDLQVLKKLGFNMLRKHIKIETALFYQACDELGLLLVQDMPALRPTDGRLPNAAQQTEFVRQLELMIEQHKSYPSIMAWVIYNEGWGQLPSAPEVQLAERVRELDPTRLINAASGWTDHGAGDFDDNHHYANPQCGSPFYSLPSGPYDGKRVGFQGEFGGIGHNVTADHLWKVQAAINTINQTYEIDETLESWNYRGHVLLSELREQVEKYACSGAVWTQTTDVEGEVNGLLTYDRRILRTDEAQWTGDIKALYDAAAKRRA